jgi:hypothetical protein
MTEHEIRTERILLEILHLCYAYVGMTAHSTANPRLMKELESDAIGIYLKMYAELSTQVMKENPDSYQKLLTDYKV